MSARCGELNGELEYLLLELGDSLAIVFSVHSGDLCELLSFQGAELCGDEAVDECCNVYPGGVCAAWNRLLTSVTRGCLEVEKAAALKVKSEDSSLSIAIFHASQRAPVDSASQGFR